MERAPIVAATGLQGQDGVHGGDGSAAARRGEAPKPLVLIERVHGNRVRALAFAVCRLRMMSS